MAKLSAHGKELVRVSKETHITDPDRQITWERTTIVLMNDGKLLKKRDVKFKPLSYETDGQKHCYGWKAYGKVKVTVEVFVRGYLLAGYSKE